jgi:hypothetical protein
MTNCGGALMTRKRRFHPLVADDLLSGVGYYDNISVELGNRFRTSVRSRLEVISARPESFAIIHDKMRASMIDRFPYVILYEIHDEMIAILGVFHAASDQKGWFERSL